MKQLRNFKINRQNIPDEVKNNPAFSDAMQKYGNMGEDALIEQLLNQVRTARKNGTYSAEQTENYVNMLSPHLSSAQREKLNNVLHIISSENV